MSQRIFSFDVESFGLMGAPFAVGWCVFEYTGDFWDECSSGYAALPFESTFLDAPIRTKRSDEEWVRANVLPHLPAHTHDNRIHWYQAFFDAWEDAGSPPFLTYNGYPVEARFLEYAFQVCPDRMVPGEPILVLDLAQRLFSKHRKGDDFPPDPGEMPSHHPTNDARRAGRIWCQLEFR